jgi:hypothetical protein
MAEFDLVEAGPEHKSALAVHAVGPEGPEIVAYFDLAEGHIESVVVAAGHFAAVERFETLE